ncbi:MAG: glycosyltransferase family 2 protein [Rubellimicrobium sp.]|nr:glycosyltransferase family 2 protein [Rubellimicrobium sp.]
MKQTYSVIIPAWNATAHILEALASVAAQTVPAAEIIVVDDGSTDDLTAVIAAAAPPGVRLIVQENAGPGAATTRGILASDSPVVATLDADDLWLPEKMARQLSCLSDDPALSGVFARMQSFHDGPARRWADDARSGWTRSTMVLRRAAFDRVGPMIDPPGRAGEVIDWIARAREMDLALRMIDEALARRRIHAASLTHNRDAGTDRAYLQVAWQAIRRRREREGGGCGT